MWTHLYISITATQPTTLSVMIHDFTTFKPLHRTWTLKFPTPKFPNFFKNGLWSGYTLRRTCSKMSVNRKPIAAYTMVQPSTAYANTYTISSNFSPLKFPVWNSHAQHADHRRLNKRKVYDRLSQQQLHGCFSYMRTALPRPIFSPSPGGRMNVSSVNIEMRAHGMMRLKP